SRATSSSNSSNHRCTAPHERQNATQWPRTLRRSSRNQSDALPIPGGYRARFGAMLRGLAVGLVLLAAGAAWVGVRELRRGYRSTRGATVSRFTLHSRLVHRDLREILVLPNGGGRGRELLVFLHGRGSTPDSNLRQP